MVTHATHGEAHPGHDRRSMAGGSALIFFDKACAIAFTLRLAVPVDESLS